MAKSSNRMGDTFRRMAAVLCACCLLAALSFALGGCSGSEDNLEASSEAAPTESAADSGESDSSSKAAAQSAEEGTEDAASSKGKAGSNSSSSSNKKSSSAKLVVKFVDVGQGDASIIELPDGKTMLIDTADGGASAVLSTLKADKRTKIDYLVATHPDADHIGGLAEVISSTKVSSVWMPKATSSTQTFTRLLSTIENKGLKIDACYAGRQIASGSNYSIDLLWPDKSASYSNSNDYSAVIKVTYGKISFLFTGDAPVEAEKQCASATVDVLKVSHHGSASGTNASLAKKLSPKIAVLSYGHNSYGHPTQVVLDALESAGAQVFGTYVNGTVTVSSDGNKVSASAEKKGSVVAASKNAGASSQGLNTAGGGGGSSGKAGSSGSSGSGSSSSSGKSSSASGSKPSSSPSSSSGKTSGSSSSSKSSAANDTVAITPTGSKYHREGCRTTSRSKRLTTMKRSKAEALGYAPCGVCNP